MAFEVLRTPQVRRAVEQQTLSEPGAVAGSLGYGSA
jgi:hypothetical protein